MVVWVFIGFVKISH